MNAEKKQQLAFEKLSQLRVGALFMEMGTGKTKVALDLIASKRCKIDVVLWICPYSLKTEIEKERIKWHPDLDIKIIGCETIGSSDREYIKCLEVVQTNRTFIVVDESLKIKNRNAIRTKRILRLGEYAQYRLILNGTPLTKNVLDLWPQMQFLSPKILNMSYNQFKDTYCEYYIRGKLKGRVKKQYNIEHLVSLIKPYIFDCELDIDAKKNYFDIEYSMSNSESEEYEKLKNEYLSKCFDDFTSIDFFALSQLLQEHYCGAGQKKREIERTLQSINEKAIIFVKYLKSIPEDALKITGNMSLEQRSAAIEQFKAESNILYITYGCGAYGLNLQFCKNVIFAEHSFDYAQREQAEARIYRIGQAEDVNYYNLWCDVGLECLIRKSLNKKSNLLDEVKKTINEAGVKGWGKFL